MRLIHATTRRLLPSVTARGLLARLAKGKLKAVWLASPQRLDWCVLHVCRRHHTTPDQVVVLEVDVPLDQLRRFSSRGLWYTGDVPPCRIRVAGSYQFVPLPAPVEG